MTKWQCEGCGKEIPDYERLFLGGGKLWHWTGDNGMLANCGPVRPVAQEQQIVWEGDEARLGDVVAVIYTRNVGKHWRFEVRKIGDSAHGGYAVWGHALGRELAKAACEAAMRVLAGEG